MLEKRMKEVLKNANVSQKDAAQMLGITPGELSHWFVGRAKIKAEDIKKFCNIFHTSPNYLLNDELETSTIPVIGYVQAGLWQEAQQWNFSDFKPIYMPVDEKFKGKRVFALEVRGNSMNMLYPDGSFIICVSVEDYADVVGVIKSGKRVVVQRKNPLDGTIEATVKEYNKTKEGDYLIPRSTDSGYMPIRTDDGSAGEVKIIGIVIGSFRNE